MSLHKILYSYNERMTGALEFLLDDMIGSVLMSSAALQASMTKSGCGNSQREANHASHLSA